MIAISVLYLVLRTVFMRLDFIPIELGYLPSVLDSDLDEFTLTNTAVGLTDCVLCSCDILDVVD